MLPVWRRSAIRLTLHLLDRLPWPMGEECCAALFIAKVVARPEDFTKALAWADRHRRSGQSRWRMALSLAAWQGRFRARHALLGLRSPDALLQHTTFVGQEHLQGRTGALLVGFHIGTTAVGAALGAAGHAGTLLEAERDSRSWSNPAWQTVRSSADAFPLDEAPPVLGGALYRARRRILNGERVFMTADGGFGRTAFTVPIPGGSEHVIRAGWLALRRTCRAPVFPVIAHMEGRRQVITIHPPLPSRDSDSERDLVNCREALAALLKDVVERFPEQCSGLVFDV